MPENKSPIPYQKLWRALDIAIALPLFIITLPAYVIIPLLHKIFSSESPIFKQTRIDTVTAHAKYIFEINKFRTMYGDKDKKLNAKKRGITPIGFLLRPVGIDEIPQLRQILAGEMSIFGPRPWAIGDYDVINRELAIGFAYERNRDVKTGLISPGGVLMRYPHTRAQFVQRLGMDISYRNKLASPKLSTQAAARLTALSLFTVYGICSAWKARRE